MFCVLRFEGLVVWINCLLAFPFTMVQNMQADNSHNKSILTRLVTRMLLVATFTVSCLGVPLVTDAMAMGLSETIAAPQPTLAAVKTQNKMIDKQNRADDKQNNPDGVEFGFEDEARILGVEDTLDNIKSVFGGDSSNQNSQSSYSKAKGNSSSRNSQSSSNKAVKSNSNQLKSGATNNVQRTVGNTKNLSDRSTINAKQKAEKDINKVENAAEDLGSNVKSTAKQAQKKAAKNINKVQNAAEDAASDLSSTADQAQNRAAKDINRVQNAAGNAVSNLQETTENVIDTIESDSSNQSLAKKDKTVGLDKTRTGRR